MSAKNPVSKVKSATSDPLMFADDRLIGEYSVIEIAGLAVAARGESHVDRLIDAVAQLSIVERFALAGKERMRAVRLRKAGKQPEDAVGTSGNPENLVLRYQEVLSAIEDAKRDPQTGKIILTSFVGLIYRSATGGRDDSSEAMRRFNTWVKSEAGKEDMDEAFFRKQFSSGGKPVLIHDDQTSIDLGMSFLRSLKRPQKMGRKIIQSQQPGSKGEILSPMTRGADRADREETGTAKSGNRHKPGQYKKQAVPAPVTHADLRPSANTRMDGKRSS